MFNLVCLDVAMMVKMQSRRYLMAQTIEETLR